MICLFLVSAARLQGVPHGSESSQRQSSAELNEGGEDAEQCWRGTATACTQAQEEELHSQLDRRQESYMRREEQLERELGDLRVGAPLALPPIKQLLLESQQLHGNARSRASGGRLTLMHTDVALFPENCGLNLNRNFSIQRVWFSGWPPGYQVQSP
jgi:hypothetical protein